MLPKKVFIVANVNAMSSRDLSGKMIYYLLPGSKDVNQDDLEFKEYASYVDRALASRGFIKASVIDEADTVILLSYGISDAKQITLNSTAPVWGQTGVSSSTTTGSINLYKGHGTYSENTKYQPSYGITGYSNRSTSLIYYSKYLLIDAYDYVTTKKEQKPVQLWKTTVTSNGTAADLRRVLPLLVVASQNYLGSNSGQIVQLRIPENDPRVIAIKGLEISDKTESGSCTAPPARAR